MPKMGSISQADLDLYLPLAGGTMSGAIAMGTEKITNVGIPANANDATRKTYVDTAIDDDVAAHAALATVHQNAPALISTHAALASVHHAKYTNAEALAAAKAGAGVTNGDLIQADAVGLPAIDGSQLTGITGVTTFAALTDIVIARKTSDQTLTQESTTFQNVTEMLFAVGANEVWEFILCVIQNSGATPDIKLTCTIPSGCSGFWIAGNIAQDSHSLTSNHVLGGAGSDYFWRSCGIVVNGATAGNIQLQAAQNTSDASDTKVLTNSYLIAHKIS